LSPSPEQYEKLGAFYLGREYDLDAGAATEDLVLYDARDLTTHAVCVGMTGSGKTGLCIGLLEEAALDGIPSIVIDPKGDLTNLLLTFPELRPDDFEPWVDADQAARAGMSTSDFAASQADLWRKGLAQWGQDPERIERLRAAAEFAIYTPGSDSGRPLSVLSSLAAPPAAVRDDADAMRDQVSSTTSSLLALLGIEADPVRSREHILLSMLLERAWSQGHDLDLASLIGMIQDPPLERVGVLDLDSFYPAKDRFELAMTLNSLLAAPGFAAWMQGEPLDIDRLLYDDNGRPRVAVIYTAHLTERERMFVVSLVLGRMLSWTRAQSGTSSLRALLYMDEVFGYMPPVAEPPSKRPLLTLLKQARAFGVGVVLATQNPVDLDYKGLSNTGTWFLGRLQTERDKQRVLDGLESAAPGGLDRARLERILSGLGKRVFLMHNVHEDRPVIFETRWVMSYLRGPLTRSQIRQLEQPGAADSEPAGASASPAAARALPASPVLAPEISQVYLPLKTPPGAREVVYSPQVVGVVDVLYADSRRKVEATEQLVLAATVDADAALPLDWGHAERLPLGVDDLATALPVPGSHEAVPSLASQAGSYRAWQRQLIDWIYRERTYDLLRSPSLGETSEPGESERSFRIRIADRVRVERDAATEDLRGRYARKFAALRERIRKAELAVDREADQARSATLQTAISVGATLLSAVLGRKTLSSTTIGKATTAARGAGRAASQASDVGRARENVAKYQQQLDDLEQAFESEVEELRSRMDPAIEAFETVVLKPRKREIGVRLIGVGWLPYAREGVGLSPLY